MNKKQKKKFVLGLILGIPANYLLTQAFVKIGFGGVLVLLVFYWSLDQMWKGIEAINPECEGCYKHREDCVFKGETKGEML